MRAAVAVTAGTRLLNDIRALFLRARHAMRPHLQTASCVLVIEFGEFRLHGFNDSRTGPEHAALCAGDLGTPPPVFMRVHSECLTGDMLHSLHCDCGKQLRMALETMAEEGRGVLLYLRQEGRGIDLVNKIRAHALQQEGAARLTRIGLWVCPTMHATARSPQRCWR